MRRCQPPGLLALAMLVASCAVGPDFVRPKAPPADHYTSGAQPTETVSANGLSQSFRQGVGVAADWWTLFGSPELNAMMNQALGSNLSLQAAQANLRRSEDNLRAGYGIFFPQADVGASYSRERFTPARFGTNAFPASDFNLYALSGTVTYFLDIWGGQRRAVENLAAQADLQRYALAATYLTVTGNIVNTVIAQTAYREQLRANQELISMLQEQIRLTKAQAQGGTAPYSNVLTLQIQLSSLEAALPALQQRVDEADHLLANLTGRTPAEWTTSQVTLAALKLPVELPVSLPSELVRQRPDILEAEATLHSSSAEIGVATANMLPSISLNANVGVNSTALNTLFSESSLFYSLGAGLTAPLFHGGTLWFQRKAAIEAFNQSLASYKQTVLNAFEQVADTLRGLQHDAEALRATTEELEAADRNLKLVQANYRAGIVNYLQVLIANFQYRQASISQIQAQALRLQDTVALFVALGGGWWKVDQEKLGSGHPVQ